MEKSSDNILEVAKLSRQVDGGMERGESHRAEVSCQTLSHHMFLL